MTDISKAFEEALLEQKHQYEIQEEVNKYKEIIVGLIKILPKKKQRRVSALYWKFIETKSDEDLRRLEYELESINLGL